MNYNNLITTMLLFSDQLAELSSREELIAWLKHFFERLAIAISEGYFGASKLLEDTLLIFKYEHEKKF